MIRLLYSAVASALVLALAAVCLAGPAGAAPPPPPKPDKTRSAAVVVKVDRLTGGSIEDLTARYPITVVSTVLASRGIYLVRSTDPRQATDPKAGDQIAADLDRDVTVEYAERNLEIVLDGAGYHAWPDGGRDDLGTDPAAWTSQSAATELRLDQAHPRTSGAGVTVAVLDTGVDAGHPNLQGRLGGGYDYVADDPVPDDVATGVDTDGNGVVDNATGHGTFVTGVVALVAPQTTILPLKVLDSDGIGNVFTVAQAIRDATAQGVKAVNLSFGTSEALRSKVLTEAIREAQRSGAIVIAAAGNDADGRRTYYPAGEPEVLGVGALDAGAGQLASYSNYGPWVAVAARGSDVVSTVPGGRFARWSGTSMATPFVTGEAALLAAGNPKLKNKDTQDVITRAIRKLSGSKKIKFGGIDLIAALKEARVP